MMGGMDDRGELLDELMRCREQRESLSSAFEELSREVKSDVSSLRENVNSGARFMIQVGERVNKLESTIERKVGDLTRNVDSLSESIHGFLALQQTLRGTGTFLGWLKETVKYISIVMAALSTIWYVFTHGMPPP